MSYTIWLLPKEEEVRQYMATVVADLAQKWNGPQFEPHTTLLGDVQLSIEAMEENCRQLAQQTSPFEVETGAVEYSTTYYQCIFVRIKPNPELMGLYDRAKQIFGMTTPSLFMPHMSLFYGNVPYSTRQEIMTSLTFLPQHYSINSLVVTPGGEHPPAEWKHLFELPFSKI